MNDAGDNDPALETGATRARRLGVRCGKLPDDKLFKARSDSLPELVGRALGKSVRI
jgi:hypothetical protein